MEERRPGVEDGRVVGYRPKAVSAVRPGVFRDKLREALLALFSTNFLYSIYTGMVDCRSIRCYGKDLRTLARLTPDQHLFEPARPETI